MSKRRFGTRCFASICLVIWLCVQCVSPAAALESTTLYNGSRGEEVRELQQALIDLGYLRGTADGIFGNNTENAVRKFQKANKLSVDGLAGKKTRQLILSQAQTRNTPATPTPQPAVTPAPGAQEPSSLGGSYAPLR